VHYNLERKITNDYSTYVLNKIHIWFANANPWFSQSNNSSHLHINDIP